MSEATWHATVLAADVDQPTRVDVAGNPVLVAVIDGSAYAVADACLHRGLSLAGGRCAEGVITCPEHWWRYDLRTGEHLGSPGEYLPTYPARINAEGIIEVSIHPAPTQPSLREALLAHARAGRPNSEQAPASDPA